MATTTFDTAARVRPERRASRAVLAFAATGFLALLATQVYFAGLMLFHDGDFRSAHEGLGWTLGYWPFVTIGAAAFARPGRAFWLSLTALFVLVHIQPFLAIPTTDSALGPLRALHPLNAMAIALLAWHQVRASWRLARGQ